MSASLLLDGQGRILEGNRDAEVFLEKPLEEVRKTTLAAVNPALYQALKELLAKSRRGRGVEDYAMAYKVGRRLLRLRVSVVPYPLEALDVTGTLVTITTAEGKPPPRKEGKERPQLALELGETGLEGFLEKLHDPCFILDGEAVFLYANSAMLSFLGHAGGDVVGRPLSFFLAGGEGRGVLDSLLETVRRFPWRGEMVLRSRGGESRHLALTMQLVEKGPDGGERILCIGRIYDEEARLRREREDELHRLWALLEEIGLPLVTFTPDLRVTFLSRSAEELLGVTRDRAIGETLSALFTGEVGERVSSLAARAVESGEAVEGGVEATWKEDTGRLAVEVKPAVVEAERPREYMLLMRREEAAPFGEEHVREMGERLWLLETALRAGKAEVFLEEAASRLRETGSAKAGGIYLVRGDRLVLAAAFGLREGLAERLKSLCLRPGYSGVCSLLSSLSVEIKGGVPRRGWEELRSILAEEDRLLPVLREERWRNMVCAPLRGGAERGGIVLLDCEDEERAAAVVALYGKEIAEILDGLSTVLGSGSPVDSREEGSRETVDDPKVVPFRRNAREEREGFKEGVDLREGEEHRLLEHAREVKAERREEGMSLWKGKDRSFPSPTGIDMERFLRELKQKVEKSEGRGEIILDLEKDLPQLHTDPLLLAEVMEEILRNALKHSPEGSAVLLGAERWGDEVLLRVEDRGAGIPVRVVEEVMRREAGKQEAGGSEEEAAGGLRRCLDIMRELGGTVSFKSRPGEGTTVFVRLRILPFIGGGG